MTGVFPSILKTAKVVPVFKEDSKLDYISDNDNKKQFFSENNVQCYKYIIC